MYVLFVTNPALAAKSNKPLLLKSDESASHREIKFTVHIFPAVNMMLEMCRSWNIARPLEVAPSWKKYLFFSYLIPRINPY